MVGRFITMREKMAPAFAVTGGICLGVAACTKGTLVNELTFGNHIGPSQVVRIGHPCGVMDVEIKMDGQQILSCLVGRTARRIMDGFVYV